MTGAVIAVVDDDQAMLGTISAILTDEGYQVLRWSEGRTAYDFVRRHQPNLLIVDLRMEHPQAGWLIIHMLRRNPQTVMLPVLVCTGDVAYIRMHAQTLRAEHCEILLKPFSVDELLNKVNQLLNQTGVADEDAEPTAGDSQSRRGLRWKRIAQRIGQNTMGKIYALKRRR